jgi:GAF domain-containing protein
MTQISTEGRLAAERPVSGPASLRTRLIVATTAITALAIAILGYYFYARLQESDTFLVNQLDTNVRQQAQDSLAATVEAQAASLNEFFRSMRQDLGILGTTATALLSHQATSTGPTIAPVTLARLPNGSWDNPNGDLAAVFIPARVPSVDPLLSELNTLRQLDTIVPQVRQSDPDAVAIYFGGSTGETVYYPNIDLANIVPPDFDVTQRPWYIAASPKNDPKLQPVWSVPYLDAARHGLVVTTSAPVRDAIGTFRGVIAMDIQLNQITDLVSNVQIGGTGFAFLLDPDLRIIAMPPAAYTALGVTSEQLPLGQVMDASVLGNRVPSDFLPKLHRLMTGQSPLETVNINGMENFLAYHAVPEVGYALILMVPSPELLAGASAARQQVAHAATDTLQISLVLVIGIMMLALLATLILGNSLTSPLVSLTRTAEEIIDGNLNAHSIVESRDEIGVLARTLDSMTSALRGSIQTLEQRVKERTSALEVATRTANRRASQFEAITQVTRAISAVRNLRDLMPRVAAVITSQFGYYHVGIFLNDEKNDFAYLIAANSEGGHRMLARHHRLKIGEQGIVGRVAETGDTRVARVVGKDSVYFDNPDLPDTKSEVALPLRSGDRIVGVLDVQSTEEDAFTPEDLDILAVLADQVSLAIDNTRLLETTRRSLLESETLYRQYVRGAWNQLSRDEELAGYQYTALGAMPLRRTSTGRVDGDPLDLPPSARMKTVSVPIKLRGETIGDLIVQGPEGTSWDEDQQALIQSVAERVALSAENARLFDETSRRAERERLVTEITSRIRSTNDPQQMIRTALDELRNALGAAQIQVIPQRVSAEENGGAASPANPEGQHPKRSPRNGATR